MKVYQYHDVNYRGTVQQVFYKTHNKDNEQREKYALVYLPYGYHGNNNERKYNVLYLMHGGGGNPDAWMDCCKIKNMLDYAISTGEIEPLIVVFPSFYNDIVVRTGVIDRDFEDFNTKFFQKELSNDLIPAIEGKYRTFAKDITREGIKASRMHRAFGGFSMGACTTWYALIHNLDVIGSFLPLSGDCWEVEPLGGGSKTKDTAQAIRDAVVKYGYKPEEYHVYAATGSKDIAHAALTPMMEALRTYTDVFTFSEDFSKGNLHYFVEEDWKHEYEAVYQYVYNYLPYLFKE